MTKITIEMPAEAAAKLEKMFANGIPEEFLKEFGIVDAIFHKKEGENDKRDVQNNSE